MGSANCIESPRRFPAPEVEGSLVELEGATWYRVAGFDAIPPFLMSLASDSDHWLFISSNGALTAGRGDPDHALFPYYPDDRIHDSQDQTGSKTILRVRGEGGDSHVWEPFSQRQEGLYRLTRSLCKSIHSDRIRFEEVNLDLGLTFLYEWTTSERFGFIRRSRLSNDGSRAVGVELLDGIQDVLPWGVERRFQSEYSTLVDGYKRTERVAGTGLALFRLSSIPVDKPEPSEALKVNLAWSPDLVPTRILLSSSQLGAFRRGGPVEEETDVRGRRGAYLLNASLNLEAGATKEWHIVAELGQDAAGVVALKRRLEEGSDLRTEVLADIERGARNLVRIVASADGVQLTGDASSTCRHFSNTLFNVLRGGIPDDGYRIPIGDLKRFLAQSNRRVAERHEGFLDGLPAYLQREDLLARVATQEDPDFERLAREYLPLTFSRRHGDPSRPWNAFAILVKDEQGRKILNYEGNWRDLFQNWEALGHAFPGFLESMIFKFLDASTLDGHNPYRVLRAGFEWETIDPHDPWSFIGYWGDHQVIYLLKLLEASRRFCPGRMEGFLQRRLFTFANVPYRIKPYQEMLASPRNTIIFDHDAHRRAMSLVLELGADGRVVMGSGGPVRTSLADKLLLVALAKLSNFIPGAGLWMNTQRPEWNDANNALVGYGVSMVTLCHLRRFLVFCAELFQGCESAPIEISAEIFGFLSAVHSVLEAQRSLLGGPVAARDRKAVLDALGQAGTDYREQVYGRGITGDRCSLHGTQLQAFFQLALAHLDQAIHSNRRHDGLYHAYNLMKVVGDGIEIRHLPEMLEGQVAVLDSGALSATMSAALLDALRASRLYREDQASYVLYPDHPLPHFLEKNNVSPEAVQGSALLSTLQAAGDRRILSKDVDGCFHFNASFRNAEELRKALEGLKGTAHEALAAQEGQQILDLYEQVFDHQSFTGRSGTFYKYEGLGCIYWHMVSKLLLAVDETRERTSHEDPDAAARLERHYEAIRAGIGVHKSPAVHGAIPTDPYSHTPGFAGAQQPGMTGQVKEDILTRMSEMGVHVNDGRIAFVPRKVRQEEFLGQSRAFDFIDVEGNPDRFDLAAGTLAFTLCQVPVVLHRAGPPQVRVSWKDDRTQVFAELAMDAVSSRAVFERNGAIKRLDVFLGLS